MNKIDEYLNTLAYFIQNLTNYVRSIMFFIHFMTFRMK